MRFRGIWLGAVLLMACTQPGCSVSARTNARRHVHTAAAAVLSYDYVVVQQELEAARSLGGRTAETEALQGAIDVRLGLMDQAIAAFRRAGRLRPSYSLARADMSALLLAQGRFREALAEAESAIRLDSHQSALQNNLGVARRALGNLAAADAAFRLAMRVDPRNPYATSNHAFMLWERGENDAAIRHWESAAYLDRRMADARAGLALGLWTAGQRSKAVQSLGFACGLDAAYRYPVLVHRKYHWSERALATLADMAKELPPPVPHGRLRPAEAVEPFGTAQYLDEPLVTDIATDATRESEGEYLADAGS